MTTRQPAVLVVDDEPSLRALLEQYLGGRGFAVRLASGGAEMRAALREEPVDLILLDVNMPGESGLALLGWLRASGDRRPVILLTSRHELDDRVGGVRAGADDYIVKPFEPREVLARLRAVLRRVPPQPAPVAGAGPIRLGRCWFDPTGNRLTRAADGAEVPLTAGEGELLRALARHPGLTLSRARLAELACGEDRGGRGVDSHILRLRRKLEADPSRPTVLVTRPGSGYALLPGEG